MNHSVRISTAHALRALGERTRKLGILLEQEDGLALRRSGLGQGVCALRTVARRSHGVPATVLDIGAHVGQFARLASTAFPDAVIHSFEPLPEPFAQLEAACSAIGARAHAHRVALGRVTGALELFVHEFTAASSSYRATPLINREFPHAGRVVGRESVCAQRLDDWAASWILTPPVLLKVDVQGAEVDVFDGAERTLGECVHVILVEASMVPLYADAPLFADVVSALARHGFAFADTYDEMRSADDNLMQLDSVFIRS